METKTFTVIAALDLDRGIGKDGAIPWRLPEDLKRFKEVTMTAPEGQRNVVIMGRKTYESIPTKYRPLAGRHNIVVTRHPSSVQGEDTSVATGFEAALFCAAITPDTGEIFVIGGGEIYREAIEHPECATLDLTLIEERFGCDTFFPEYSERFAHITHSPLYRHGELAYSFATYRRKS